MNYANLGRTGLKVSRICLGTMNFGPHTTEADSFAIMSAALEDGVNFFDTANVYGRREGEGISEQIIGRWFAEGQGRRDQTVLATKVYGSMGPGPNEKPGLSALKIKKECEGSLRRLQTDYIDLYQMHHIARETPWDEVWQAMEQLIREGKVLYVGSSNFAGWHITQACERARQRNLVGLVSEQSLYNLFERRIEQEVIPACASYGLGILPWSPLSGGFLAGVLDGEGVRRKDSEGLRKRIENNREPLQAYEGFSKELGHSPAKVGLAWLLHKPHVTAPIVGPRTLQQYQDAVAALEIKLDEATMTKLESFWPASGKPAPEAYAW